MIRENGSRYFVLSEFEQPGLPGSGRLMDAAFLNMLDELRHRCGFPFVITSGYRTPDYNMQVSHTGAKGPHTMGKAADIQVHGERALILLGEAYAMGFSGFGINQRGPFDQRYIHLDTLKPSEDLRPWCWTY